MMMSVQKWCNAGVTALLTALACACGGGAADGSADGGSTGAAGELADVEVLLRSAGQVKDGPQLLHLADSLQATGYLSEQRANYYRGMANTYLHRSRTAELFWTKVVQSEPATADDLKNFYTTAASLVGLLVNKGDYDGALRVAVKAMTLMEQRGGADGYELPIILESVGRCQLDLGRYAEAAADYDRAYALNMQLADGGDIEGGLRHALISAFNTSLSYLGAGRYQESLLWTMRGDTLLDRYCALPDAPHAFTDMLHARQDINRAIALEGMQRGDEAAQSYLRALDTDYGHSSGGKVDATKYLVAARRYAEAADNFSRLDQVLADWGYDLSVNTVQTFLFPKFRANVGAGRRDSAIAVGMHILNILDTAIVSAKKNEAAELAIIYDTQRKETEIAHQKAIIADHDAQLSRQRMTGILALLLLVVAAFIAYALLRRRSQRRLAVAHRQLQEAHAELQDAYADLERTTADKEKMESELRIARDIQMAMLPGTFPSLTGLDLYASMAPAKFVGGDLYSYVLTDGDDQADGPQPAMLYFAVGDVSGKGVSAALFMAQTTRLFRTLASQRMMPADIANRMNAALSEEDNVSGMFVTMFIGMLNLQSGRLDFCNAGHTPPVIGDGADGAEFLDVSSNVPFGLWPGVTFEGQYIASIKGRPLFIYTDGLTEAENGGQSQFGDERMLSALRRMRYDSSRQVVECMAEAVEEYRDGAEPSDDLAMMCLHLD